MSNEFQILSAVEADCLLKYTFNLMLTCVACLAYFHRLPGYDISYVTGRVRRIYVVNFKLPHN